jgi:hypothetical protein
VLRANQRLRDESFVEKAVRQSQEKQAHDGKAPAESELTNDDKGEAVGKQQESRRTGIQQNVRRRVPGHDFGEHGRDDRDREEGPAAGCHIRSGTRASGTGALQRDGDRNRALASSAARCSSAA